MAARPSDLSDDALLERCRRSDRRAQQTLYERYAPQMMSVCLRYAGDRDQAADILQEGFIKVFRNLAQFRGEGVLEGWIRRIMVNTALAHLRKQKRRPESDPLEHARAAKVPPSAIEELSAQELRELIQRMPSGYRRIFNLYVVEGYEHQDIAEELGISVGTSKSQLARGRQWLKNQLAQINVSSYEVA